jgi:hypothetical protein
MGSVRYLAVLLLAGVSFGQATDTQPLTAEAIMARVAANQDKAEALRKQYVYKQHIHIVLHKTNARLMREETTDYRVVPTPWDQQRAAASERQLPARKAIPRFHW